MRALLIEVAPGRGRVDRGDATTVVLIRCGPRICAVLEIVRDDERRAAARDLRVAVLLQALSARIEVVERRARAGLLDVHVARAARRRSAREAVLPDARL